MTETEWRDSTSIGGLVGWIIRPTVPSAAIARKLRLVAAVICRLESASLFHGCTEETLERFDRFIDGKARLKDVADRIPDDSGIPYTRPYLEVLRRLADLNPAQAIKQVLEEIRRTHLAETVTDEPKVRRIDSDGPAAIRDIFGNPFRPVAFSPEWRTTAAVAIAQGMYESRDFGPMPLLADALQDAGCEVPEIMDHCRGPGPHVRGCWVVDAVLG